MKNNKKLWIIGSIAVAVVIAIILCTVLFPGKKAEKTETENTVSTEQTPLNIDDTEIKPTSSDDDTETFIEPDESEADRIIEEHKKATASSQTETAENKKPSQSTSKPKAENSNSKTQTTTSKKSETETFGESKKQLENTAENYLKTHSINPKTAGETGETCPYCGKKIWDPDKYGLCIPGMPDNYENSGYCLGTCGIKLE